MRVKRGEKCGFCGNRYLRNVAVDALAVRDERIALIKRKNDPDKGKWALPGGLLGWDESGEEAVVRELEEETGLRATVERRVGVYADPQRDKYQRITIAYEVKIESGVLKSGDDALEASWFELDQVPELAADHNKIIGDYLIQVG